MIHSVKRGATTCPSTFKSKNTGGALLHRCHETNQNANTNESVGCFLLCKWGLCYCKTHTPLLMQLVTSFPQYAAIGGSIALYPVVPLKAIASASFQYLTLCLCCCFGCPCLHSDVEAVQDALSCLLFSDCSFTSFSKVLPLERVFQFL